MPCSPQSSLLSSLKVLRARMASSQGFSLVEMVITVAVLTILVGISSPAIYEFLRQRDTLEEEKNLNEVHKAIQAYIADKGTLPADGAQTGGQEWFSKLAGYSRLSAQEMASDTWGRDRAYVMLVISRTIYGQTVSVTYATVHSGGPNGKAENSNSPLNGIQVVNDKYVMPDASTGTDKWWRQLAAGNRVAAFSSLRPRGDDLMTRYTNYTEVMDNYKLTMQRLDKISEALEVYARSGYAQRISQCTATPANPECGTVPEKTIYYPCARPVGGNDTNNQCGTLVSDNSYLFAEPAIIVDNQKNDAGRMADMIRLMQRLGLPAEFCCSALTTFTDASGLPQPKPFYYFPNPRKRGTSCPTTHPDMGAAPGSTKLPARITTDNTSDVDPNPTCG